MGTFKVSLHGRGLTTLVDDEPQRLGFYVTRFVRAADAEAAARSAVEAVLADPRSRSVDDEVRPSISVEHVVELRASQGIPKPQPGFSFYPDPETG